MKDIGQRLKEERIRLKLSQSALGTFGGVETNAQGNYENGIRSPRAEYLSRISEAGVDVAYVITGQRSAIMRSTSVEPTLNLNGMHPVLSSHLSQVTTQLHRNLHGIIEALSEMTVLVEKPNENMDKTEVRQQLDTTRVNAETLAVSTVRLMFVTTKLL